MSLFVVTMLSSCWLLIHDVGHLDQQELKELMKSIGVPMSDKRIADVMKTYDISGGAVQ